MEGDGSEKGFFFFLSQSYHRLLRAGLRDPANAAWLMLDFSGIDSFIHRIWYLF